MSKIIISASTSYLAEAATISLLNGGFVAKTARINYNKIRTIKSQNPDI